jgi:hypothetical protein
MKLHYEEKFTNSKSGYYIEKYKQKSKIDLGIQATYVIHLINNGRLQSVEEQLNKYCIKGNTYILYNEGYKCGKKEPHIDGPSKDLINAYLHIFQHALDNNYDQILILEDDFFFNEKILEKEYYNGVKDFITNNNSDLYYLGCLPYIRNEINRSTSRLYLSTGTHAVIYSKYIMKYTLKNEIKPLLYNVSDWDLFLGMFQRYASNIPLCYQLFPETLNRQHWGKGIMLNKFLSYFVKQIVQNQVQIINYMHLDKTHLIGYPYFYKQSLYNYKYFYNIIHYQKDKIKSIKNKLYLQSKWILPKLSIVSI